jgi:NhaB family Na+:H+ antiporter
MTLAKVFAANFLGNSPTCYKLIIVVFLVSNPLLLLVFGPVKTAWVLLAQFIFTLAMVLKCYPLQPGGLLAFEAVLMGLASAQTVAYEVSIAYPVILLFNFMVAGIYFMKDLLLFIFPKLLLGVHSKIRLSMLFTLVAALLSAFLDALTITAVVIAVAVGFYNIYHRSSSQRNLQDTHDYSDDSNITHKEELENFRVFLRSLIMHALVGTTLGGLCTIVEDPQNLLIASSGSGTSASLHSACHPFRCLC